MSEVVTSRVGFFGMALKGAIVHRALRHWSLAIPAALGLLVCAVSASEPAPGAGSAITRFAQLPLSFEVNQGQTDERVQFIARGHDHTVYLSPDGATIALQQRLPSTNGLRSIRLKSSTDSITCLIRMTLPGAKSNPVATGLEQNRSRVNYLLGNDPSRWQQAVPSFSKVQYDEVYPGVDVIYYGNNQRLEYDFVVAPGADPTVIKLNFAGADRVEIDEQGELVLHLGGDQLRLHRPISYQSIDGQRHEVASRYRLKDLRTVEFAFGDYDRGYALTVDPVLSYSTYFGGNKGDIGWAIAVDASGGTNRVYISGDTLSTLTKLDESFVKTNASTDAFVARLDQSDTNLTVGYLTYLGGKGLESALGIAVDGAGSAYVTGYTTSTNFPAFPPTVLQPRIAGTNIAKFNTYFTDAFVTKLDANGGGVYSTYFGGEFSETGADIAVDAGGSVSVVGYTDSMRAYFVTNRLETTVCTNSICGATITSTNTQYVKLLVDPYTTTNTVVKTKGNTTNIIDTIVTTEWIGSLTSTNLPVGMTVVNGVQTNNGGLVNVLDPDKFGADLNNFTADLFISKISADGSALVFSTYLGGDGEDFGTGIAVDPAGNTIVSGYTRSSNFPTTNAFETTLGGSRDAVVAKFDPSGALVYSTFLGGSGNDAAYRVAADADGFAYVAGAAGSSDFPRTPGARNRGGVFQNVAMATNAWSLSSSGLTHTTVSALLVDPSNSGTLYAGTPRGVFKTTDGGANWIGRSTGLVNRAVSALAINLGDGTLYAGTPGGVFTSTNGSVNWINRSGGSAPASARAILFEPGSTNTIYAATSGGVYKTTNGVATNWFTVNSGLENRKVNGLAATFPSVSTIYAATEGGVFKSTNSGAKWKGSNSGLKNKRAKAIVIDPSSPDTLYVGTAGGLYKSMNAGTNWTFLTISTNPAGKPAVSALALDPSDSSTVFAGTSSGLYKSTDAGSSWALTQTNQVQNLSNVTTLTFSASGADIYAGTVGFNVFAGGTNDAFLAKLAPDGLSLAYALTLGGAKNDEAWDVAVDAAGFATLVGQTASKDFPIAGFDTNSPAYQTNLTGKIDAFVSKFDPTGATNIFTMFFGGKGNDFGHSVALDSFGDTYIVGRTESSKLPTTNGLDTVSETPVKFGGGKDAFVAKLITGILVPFIEPAGDQVIVSWRAPSPEFILESRDLFDGEWTPVAEQPIFVKGRNTVVLPAATAGRFFRLRTR